MTNIIKCRISDLFSFNSNNGLKKNHKNLLGFKEEKGKTIINGFLTACIKIDYSILLRFLFSSNQLNQEPCNSLERD